MADRTVYGLTNSENGWRMVDQGSCVWVAVPGTNVHLQIREGQPAAILGAFVADWNAYIEPVYDADSACWTATNSVASSNHLSGTACDVRWNSHPFRIANAGFNDVQLATMREMLKFYEGMVFWGNDWQSPKDAMHVQMGYDTYGSENGKKVQDFIARKIRADGFSTFRRANNPSPPPPPVVASPALSRAEGYAVRIINEGRRRGVTPKGIQIALATGIVESNITVYANQKLPKSLALPHDAVGNDGYSVGIFQQQVRDTGGGWWWGDEQTCMGVESSAGLFYDRLVKLPYNGDSKSPGAFAQQIQGSAFPGRYDQHWGEAVALYNKLAGITDQGEDDLSAEAEALIRAMSAKIDRLDAEWTAAKQGPTRSFLAPDANPVDSPLGFLYNIDGNVWNVTVTWGYLFGVKRAEELVNSVARNGVAPASWAGQLTDAQGHWLAEWGQQWCLGLISFRAAIQKAFKANGVTPTVASSPQVMNASITSADVQDIANRVSQQIAIPAPTPAPPAQLEVAQEPGDDWDTVADIGRSLEALKLADALPIDKRAPLQALISILQTKNGSQI